MSIFARFDMRQTISIFRKRMENLEGYANVNANLTYNTQKRRLQLPEYGRNVQKMIEYVKSIPDREERNRQARAVIGVMETINPQVHLQDDYEHKLWDHMYIISGFDLDVDSPYPAPKPEELNKAPLELQMKRSPVKIAHYGRNIENIIDLIAKKEDGEVKTAMIRSIALYMRQQYLIWNKDSVSDETIFNDIVKLSAGRITIPEGMHLSRIQPEQSFTRPGMNQSRARNMQRMKNGRQKNGRK